MRKMPLVLSAIALAAVVAADSPAFALDRVVYGTASRPGLANAALYLAETLGYFEQENIAIETIQFDGTSVLLPQVANRSIDIGYPIPDFLVMSHDADRDPLPIKFFYNVNRLYNWEIVVPADSPINTIEDLAGATIGVNSLATGNVPVTRSILSSVGLEVGTDVNLIATPIGAAAINALRSGQIDALNLFDVFHSQIELGGFPIRRLELPERYNSLSGNSFATHVDTFRDNPDLLKRFGRAYSKGLTACVANPELCVRAMWDMHPATRPTDGDEAENMEGFIAILQTNLGFKLPEGFPEDPNFGEFTPVAFDTLISVLYENEIISTQDIDHAVLYTNEFVPDFGDFDMEAISAEAAAMQ